MHEAIARGGIMNGVVGSFDRLEDDNEDTRGEDELGKLGNETVIFRGNQNVQGRFTCEVSPAQDPPEQTLMPPKDNSFCYTTNQNYKIETISPRHIPRSRQTQKMSLTSTQCTKERRMRPQHPVTSTESPSPLTPNPHCTFSLPLS